MKVPLCRTEEVPTGGVKTVDFFGQEVLVLEIFGRHQAVLNYRTHLGGSTQREGLKLACEGHGAESGCEHGLRLKGPARREARLIILPTRIEDGMVMYVDEA